MKILVTGNRGYIGSVLTEVLTAKGYEVVGFDTGFYEENFLTPASAVSRQIIKDIRNVSLEDVQGIDAIVHLAALSNDPLGELQPGLTEEINLKGTLKLAELAKQTGVKRFVYSSSQSMYGVADTSHELTEGEAGPYGVTAYARTKWDAECALKEMGDDNFSVICMRPSTVFGVSPNLRCDIVYNNLVGSAYVTGKIEIKSDGTPWRPVVHVRDVSNAFIAALEAPLSLVAGESFNVGIPNGNFTVKDLAEAAQRVVPGSELTFTGEHGSDSRTYRVSFEKILTVLKDYFHPEWDLDRGGKELVEFFKTVNFTEASFRGPNCNRLKQITHLLEDKKLDNSLRWTESK